MNVIVWGCGTMGRRIFCALNDRYGMKIVAYTDSSESVWGDIQYTGYFAHGNQAAEI